MATLPSCIQVNTNQNVWLKVLQYSTQSDFSLIIASKRNTTRVTKIPDATSNTEEKIQLILLPETQTLLGANPKYLHHLYACDQLAKEGP